MSTTLRRFSACLSIALALGGCATDVLTPAEEARLEAQGAYADGDDRASAVQSTSEALARTAWSTGFVWANDPTASSYTPNTTYSYNYAGQTNTVTRLGKGRYRVAMPGLSLGGNAQVVAYGSSPHRCALAAKPSSGVRIDVDCFDYGGTLADTTFVAFYANHDADYAGEMAYGNARYSVAAGTPTISLQEGQFVSSLVRQSEGYYTIKLDGALGSRGTPFATAISPNGSFCSIGNQSSVIAQINVHCFDKAGDSADTDFSFAYMAKPYVYGANIAVARSKTASDATVSGFYSQDWAEQNVYFDYGTSKHVVHFDGGDLFGYDPSTTLVTYFGNGAFWCKPRYWSDSNTGISVTVNCFDTTGGNRNNLTFSVGAVAAGPEAFILPL